MKPDKQKISNGIKEVINFLIEVSKLKETPRTGWVLRKVRNPETIAEHSFRLAILSWLLAEKADLNVKRAIKIALFHDLCEVYAGDVTPFFYYTQLRGNEREKQNALMRWVRLSKKEKEKMGKMKSEREKKALLKLVQSLDPHLKNDILSSWSDFENRISKEGKFVKQIDKIETLLQSIEYFGSEEKKGGSGWWECTEEAVDDPLLLDFLKVIQKRFYKNPIKNYRGNKYLENILDFILEIGKLKKMSGSYWTLREVKNPETVASHMFDVALIAWALSKGKKVDVEKLLKMALCHEMSAVLAGDTTLYDRILPKRGKEKKEILKKWPRIPKMRKEKIFFLDYKKEKEAIGKLTKKLEPKSRNEIMQLWKEYKTKTSAEGHLLPQLNVLGVLIQALLYEKKDSKCSAAPIWEWAFEICDNEDCFTFLDEVKKKFYK